MSKSIDIFLAPDDDTVQNLDTSLNALRNDNALKSTVPDHAFQVATLLLSHSRISLVREGVDIMERLAFRAWSDLRNYNITADNKTQETKNNNKNNNNNNNNTDDDATRSNRARTMLEKERVKARETLMFGYFLLAIGQYKLGDFSAARNSVERMLELEPHHPQGIALRDRIDEVVMKNAVIGVTAVAAGVVAVGAVLKGLFGK